MRNIRLPTWFTIVSVVSFVGFFLWYLSPIYWPYLAHQRHEALLLAFFDLGTAPGRTISTASGITPTGIVFSLVLGMAMIRLAIAMKYKTSGSGGTAAKADYRTARQYRTPRSKPFSFANTGTTSTALSAPTSNKALAPALNGKKRGRPEQRLILGKFQGVTISLSQKQQQENVLLTASIGAGKTVLVILRNLLREVGLRSLFIADVKAELVRLAAGYLAQFYTVRVFAPGRAHMSNGYNPLAHVHNIRDAQALADCWLKNTTSKHNDDDFWMKSARRLFVAAVLHVRRVEPRAPFYHLAEMLSQNTYEEQKRILTASPDDTARAEAIAAFDAMDKNERMSGGIQADMGVRFDVMTDDQVKKTTSYNEIDFTAMTEKPIALFFSIPPRDMSRCRPLMACFITQMFSEWEIRAEQAPNGQLPLPVECYLDEFANLGHIPDLGEHLTTMRHIGVGLLIVLQAFAQLDERYSVPLRKIVLANSVTHLLLPGSGQDECEFYSARIGDTTVPVQSQTSTPQGYFSAQRSYTTTERSRRLYTPDEMRTMESGTMMVLAGREKVMMVKTTPWFEDRETRDRGNMPFAVSSTYVSEEPEDDNAPTQATAPRFPLPGPKAGPGGNTGRVVDADRPKKWRSSGFSPE